MSDIGNVFDKAVSTPSFFNPNEETKKKNVPNVKGEYFGHMIEAEQKEVEFERDGAKYKAIVYNYKVMTLIQIKVAIKHTLDSVKLSVLNAQKKRLKLVVKK